MSELPDLPPDRSDPPATGDDPWAHLRRFTPARIGLGRSGVSATTREVLAFSLAHAQARDAIHLPLDVDLLAAQTTIDNYERRFTLADGVYEIDDAARGRLLREGMAPSTQAPLADAGGIAVPAEGLDLDARLRELEKAAFAEA